MSTELDNKVLRKATPSGGWREPTVIAASFVNPPQIIIKLILCHELAGSDSSWQKFSPVKFLVAGACSANQISLDKLYIAQLNNKRPK